MELDTLIERTQQLREALPVPNVKQRMAAAAQELSLAGSNQARVELLNEAVLALAKVLYEVDPDGWLANLDPKTHRILIPVPWGRAGWKKWGMRYWESEILRQILIVRGQMQRVAPVYDYNDAARTWHLNHVHYPRFEQALMYWKANPISLKEWRIHADAYRQRAQARMERYRGE